MILTFAMLVCFLVAVTPTAIPGQNDEDKALEVWAIAVIAGVAGLLVIVILIVLIFWFRNREKTAGGKEISHKTILISV